MLRGWRVGIDNKRLSKMGEIMDIVGESRIHFHLAAVQDIAGFSMTNIEKEHYAWILTKASITSDEPDFYKYIEICNPFFNE